MNDTLTQLVEKAGKNALTLLEYAEKNVPFLVREILYWAWASNFLAIVVCLVTARVVLKGLKHCWKELLEDGSNGGYFAGVMATGFLFLLSMGIAIGSTFDLVKALVAQRLYLLEFFAGLIKHGV